MRNLLVAMCVFAGCVPSAHGALRVAAERARYDEVALEALALTLTREPRTATRKGGLGIRLEIGALDLAAYGYRFERFTFACTIDLIGERHECSGPVGARLGGDAVQGTLALKLTGERVDASLARDAARLSLRVPRRGDPAAVTLKDVPLPWLAGLVRTANAKLAPGAGTLSGKLSIAAAPVLAGTWSLAGAGFDTPDGSVAAAGLAAAGTLEVAPIVDGARAVSLAASLAGGELLVSPLYLKLPDHPVAFSASLALADAGIEIPRWSWRDDGALVAQGSASLAPDGAPRALAARYDLALPQAYARYAQSVLAPAGLGALATAGAANGTLSWGGDHPLALTADFADLSIGDAARRFAVGGLNGRFALGIVADTRLSWSEAAIYDMPVGPATLVAASDADGWRLTAPLAVDLLDGRLTLDRYAYTRGGAVGTRVDAGLTLERLSVGALAEKFGWPKFGGTLSGRIPAIRSEGEALAFDGGLTLDLFDGQVTVGALAMERPFGVAPSLAAEVTLADLDLALVTNAFSFGSIEGRLDGRVQGLRLVDWKPVAFDLALHTDRGYDGRRRISQRAVSSLSSVGGGGAVAGLQAGVMKVFDSFPYAEIGLSCKLANNVCEMGGVDSGGGAENRAYTIVRGSGLPHLTVQGYQRRVDWPVLVERLRDATRGATSPVIE